MLKVFLGRVKEVERFVFICFLGVWMELASELLARIMGGIVFVEFVFRIESYI